MLLDLLLPGVDLRVNYGGGGSTDLFMYEEKLERTDS